MKRLPWSIVFIAVGCAGKGDPKTSTEAVNADPKGNLEKIYRAWRSHEAKNGFPPGADANGRSEGLEKYLKEHGNPAEIMKGIGFRFAYPTARGADGQIPLAWQESSKNNKYYMLFANGSIREFDEDEMNSHGIGVGKHRREADKSEKERIAQDLRENELRWKKAKDDFDEEMRTHDAKEKMIKTPKSNPAEEDLRKNWLEHDLKELNERRASTKSRYETARKVYEEQKQRLQKQLAK